MVHIINSALMPSEPPAVRIDTEGATAKIFQKTCETHKHLIMESHNNAMSGAQCTMRRLALLDTIPGGTGLDFVQPHKKKHVKLTVTKIRRKEPLIDLEEGGEDSGG